MSKVTILLCGSPQSAVGGGPTHMNNMLASPLNDRYSLIHFESGSRGTESPAKDEKIRKKISRILFSPFQLALTILLVRPQIVHLNTAIDHKGFWRDLVYTLVCKLLLRKVVLQVHGGSIETLCKRKWMRYIVQRGLAIPDVIVLLAASIKSEFEQLGIDRNLVVIPNGVNISEYRVSGERHHSGKVKRLAFLGRLIPAKGVLEAIQAVAILRKQSGFQNLELYIAGSGPARETIEEKINDLGLHDSVKVIGSIFGNEKIHFLQEADILLFPSYSEGLPYVILESLAAGTPVIATRVGGIPEAVIDRVHGILIKPKDPAEIVSAVYELSQSEEALSVMSRNCVEWAEQKYGLERLATQFEKLYENVRS